MPVSRAGVATLVGTLAGEVIVVLVSNLINSAVGTSLLLVLAVVGVCVVVAVFAPVVGRSARGSGELGIVLDLDPGDERRDWDGHPAAVALSQARRQGRAVPISARLSADPTLRAGELRDVRKRINEASGDRKRAVSLYPNATTHDSFTVGRLIRSGSFPTTLMQRSQSAGGSAPFFPSIGLGDHLRVPLGGVDSQRAERFLRHDEPRLAADTDRLALMVVLSGPPGGIRQSMLSAAGTGRSERYAIGPADRCRAALVVEATESPLPSEREVFELTVRHVHEQWTTWLARHGGAGEHLLFFAGPNTIAMALGWVFSSQPMRPVAHIRP